MASNRYRIERVNGDLLRELNLLISNDLRDPVIQEAVITVTDVKTTKDLKEAKVFVSIREEEETKKRVLKALENAAGFLRTELSKTMSTYTAPALRFKIDNSEDYREQIEDILEVLRENGEISDTVPTDFEEDF